jgi:hypothetical protein
MSFEPSTYIDDDSYKLLLDYFANNNIEKNDVLDENIIKLMANDQFENYIKYYKISDLKDESDKCSKLQNFFVKVPKTNNKKIDIDLSFYAKSAVKQEIFKLDFEAEYLRNLAELKKCRYEIDKDTILTHTFEFHFKYIPIYNSRISGLNWIKKKYDRIDDIKGTEINLENKTEILKLLNSPSKLTSDQWKDYGSKGGGYVSKDHYILGENNTYFIPEEEYVYENININNENISHYKVTFKLNIENLEELNKLNEDNILELKQIFYDNDNKIVENVPNFTLYKYSDEDNTESDAKIKSHITNFLVMNLKYNKENIKDKSQYNIIALQYRSFYLKILINIYILYSIFNYFEKSHNSQIVYEGSSGSRVVKSNTIKEEINNIIKYQLKIIIENFYKLVDDDNQYSIKAILKKNKEIKYEKIEKREKEIEKLEEKIEKKQKQLDNYKGDSNDLAYYGEWKKGERSGNSELKGNEKIKGYFEIIIQSSQGPEDQIYKMDEVRYNMYKDDNNPIYLYNYIKIDNNRYYPIKSNHQYKIEKELAELRKIKDDLEKSSYIKEESKQILDAKKYKSELTEINNFIEKEKKKNEKSKKVLGYNKSYLNKVDIALYFIIFIFIVIIFLFVFDYAVSDITISVPIILFSIIILTFLFLSFIQNKNNPKKKDYNFLDILFKNKIIEDFITFNGIDRPDQCSEKIIGLIQDAELQRYYTLIKHYCGLFSNENQEPGETLVGIHYNKINNYLRTDENNRLHIKFENDDIYSVYPQINTSDEQSNDRNFTSSVFNKETDITTNIDQVINNFYDGVIKIEKYNHITDADGSNKIYNETSDNINIVYQDDSYYYLIFIHNNSSTDDSTEYTLHLPVDISGADIIAIGGGGHGYGYSVSGRTSNGGGGEGAPIIERTNVDLSKGDYTIEVSRGNKSGVNNDLESLIKYKTEDSEDIIITAPNAKNDNSEPKQNTAATDYTIEPSNAQRRKGGSGGTAGKMAIKDLSSFSQNSVYALVNGGNDLTTAQSPTIDNYVIKDEHDANGEDSTKINKIPDGFNYNNRYTLGFFSAGGGATKRWNDTNLSPNDVKKLGNNEYLHLSTDGSSDPIYYIRSNLQSGKGGNGDSNNIGGDAEDATPATPAQGGKPHTGSGGGGTSSNTLQGGDGGSGIVIIKFNKSNFHTDIDAKLQLLSLKLLKESLEYSATVLDSISETRDGEVNEITKAISDLENEISTLYKELDQERLNELLDDLETKKNILIGEAEDAIYHYHYWKKIDTAPGNYEKIKSSSQESIIAAIDEFETIYNSYDSATSKEIISIPPNSKDIIIIGINDFNNTLPLDFNKQNIYFEFTVDGNTVMYRPMMTGMKNIVDDLANQIGMLESAISSKQGDINNLKNTVNDLDSRYKIALNEKSRNKADIDKAIQDIEKANIDRTEMLLDFQKLKTEYHKKVKQLIEYESCTKALEIALKDDDDGLEGKLTNNIDVNRRIRDEHTAYIESEKARKRTELRKLSNLRDLAISQVVEYETKYKDALALYRETSEEYGVSYINLKLAVDYKLAGFDFDLEDTDQSEDISKIVLNEREKRRKFVNRILSDLIKGTEELNDIGNNKKITRSRFEILRIYPDNTPDQNTETTYEPETFANFKVMEHFYEVVDVNCTEFISEETCDEDTCQWYPEYKLCGNKGTATETTTLDQYESANRYQPQNKYTIVSIKINPHQETLLSTQQITPTSDDIVDKIVANAGNLTSKLRSETRYLRYIIATQEYNANTGELADWKRQPSANIITIDDENAKTNKDTLDDIITNINILIDEEVEEIQDVDSYYDDVHKYVKKEYNDYKDKEGKILLNSRMYDDKKNIDYLDIRIKELLHQYILSVSLILCLSMILNKFIYRSIIIILLIITIVLVSVYYISGIIIVMRTKAKNSYWKKPKKELLE